MTPWDQAWDNATVSERRTVRYWKPGFSKDPHRNGMRGDRNQCAACGELFNSGHAFEKHRTGKIGKPGRKCLNIPGMLEKGFEKNYAGFWISGANSMYENADLFSATTPSSDDQD